MPRSFLCILILALVTVATLAETDRLLVYRSDSAEIKPSGNNEYEWISNQDSPAVFAVQYCKKEAVKLALPEKLQKVIICSQAETNNRSVLAMHPLSARKRSGATLLVEIELEKDEVAAIRSISTLEKSKLASIRQRIAKALKDNLNIDSISIEGLSVEGTIDLTKMAVLSDRPLLLPPFYSFELDVAQAFDLQRDISSLYLYGYLPNTYIQLLNGTHTSNLKTMVDTAEIHEQCVFLSQNSRSVVETGVAKSKHVTLKVSANTEVHVIEDCSKADQCTTRDLRSESRASSPINTLTPVSMSMTRTLHKIGFHRDLETKIQLLNVKDFDLDIEQCSLVLVETLSEDYYIDRDEVEGLERLLRTNHFDFFTQGIDIERPAYTSTQHVVVVTSNNKLTRDEQATYTVTYPIHVRYQMPTPTGETHRKTYINAPLVYLKCNARMASDGACNVPLRLDQKFSPFTEKVESAAQSPCPDVTWVPLETNHVLDSIAVFIPLGQLQHNWLGTFATLGTTVLAVVLLAGFVYKTTSSKCLEKQKDE